MLIQYIFTGFLVKIITGIDDSMVHIPIIANLTKTKIGRISFAIGIFLAITLAIIVSFLFAKTIRAIPYYNYVSSLLLLILAITIYFDIFVHKPKEKIEKKLGNKKTTNEIKKIRTISLKRFFKLVGLGFLTAFATVIDDIIAYSAILLNQNLTIIFFSIIGIYLATITQLILVVYFSSKIQKIPYKKEFTTLGLIALSALIFFKIL